MKRTMLLLGLALAVGACAPDAADDDEGMMDEPAMENADSAAMGGMMDDTVDTMGAGMDDAAGMGDDLNDGMSQDSIDGG